MSILEANTEQLQQILAAVKALPNADGDVTAPGENHDIADLLGDSLESIKCNATSIRNYMFRTSNALTSIDCPEATTIGEYAFYSCTNLSEINFPKVVQIKPSAFYQCKITTANFPLLTVAGSNAFHQCNSLRSACFQSLINMASTYFLRDCSSLLIADFPKLTNITANAFNGCRSLEALILRSETMVALANTNAFTNCYRILGTSNAGYNPGGGINGFIYVPYALIEEYSNDANWATFAANFRAIEDFPEICGGGSN